jgi:NADPH oxidase 1
MYTTAHHKIRNQCFEAFWYTHHLAFFFLIGLYTHATGCFVRDSVDPDYISTFPFYSTKHCLGYESWRFIIWPGIIYFGERVYREIRARRATRLSKLLVHPSGALRGELSCISLRSNDAGAMELRIIKPSFKYTAGQWLFLQVPEVSRWQWHPVGSFVLSTMMLMLKRLSSSPSHPPQRIPTSPSTSVRLAIGPMPLANVWGLDHPL